MTGIPAARKHSRSAAFVAFMTLVSVGGAGGVGDSKAFAKSVDSTESVLNALRTAGLQLSGDQQACVATEQSKAAKSAASAVKAPKGSVPVDQGSGFSSTDMTVGAVLRCISQDQAIRFVAGSLDLGSRNAVPASSALVPVSPAASSALVPVSPAASSKTCLSRRLRVATWTEVSEVFRSYADVLLTAGTSASTAVLSSRLQPYIRICGVFKDRKGITPLPTFTIEELRVRWNAAVQRHGVALSLINRWGTPAEVGLPGAPVDLAGNASSPANVAVIAVNSWVDAALDESSAANVSGATIVLEPPTASASVASEALYILADAIDGRDQAITVRKAFDLDRLLASEKAVERQARIGRTIYVVSVVRNPVRVFLSAFPS